MTESAADLTEAHAMGYDEGYKDGYYAGYLQGWVDKQEGVHEEALNRARRYIEEGS